MTEAEKKVARQKDNERKAEAARIRAEAARIAQEIEKNAEIPFKSPQSLAKARKRVENNLPQSPRKKRFLLKLMAPKEEVVTKPREKPGPKPVSDETKRAVLNHYEESDISWHSPGMKDFKTVRRNGVKERLQKKYLLTTLKESHRIFLENNPEQKIGLSAFCDLRPDHVLIQKDLPQNVCVCKIHENVRSLLLALNSNKPVTFRDFISGIVCDQDQEDCMLGKCKKCPGLHKMKPSEPRKECSWYEWEETEKKRISGTFLQCFETLKKKVSEFLRHTYVKRKQAEKFKQMRDNLEEGHVLIQMDFSENYACLEQDEIQTAHWGHKQLLVFTACAWYLDTSGNRTCQSFACISNVKEVPKDKFYVHCAIQKIICELKKKIDISVVNFWTDGAASQFKSRYMLCNMTYLLKQEIQASWHFFATSHGKGAVDGIGGEVKRQARLAALSGEARVQNAKEFIKVVKKKTKSICVIEIENDCVEREREVLNGRWDGIDAIPSIQKNHYFETVEIDEITFGIHSSVDIAQRHQFRVSESSSSEHEEESEESEESENGETENGESEMETECESIEIKEERYYAVYFDKKPYIGRVLKTPWLGKVSIKFLHNVGTLNEWPSRDDIATVKDKYIFMGPLTLNGNGPFEIPNHNAIIKKFQHLKSIKFQ